MLDFILLQRLRVLAECASFTKAAENLYITRSALIQQLNALEKECGFKIFERSFRGVCLTEAGKFFLQALSRIASNYDSILMRCRELSNLRDKKIIIGSLPNFAALLIPEICDEFHKEYPDVEICFRDYFPDKYFTYFQRGEFDICSEYMINYLNNNKEIALVNLLDDRHCCCVPRNSDLAGKSFITLKDLRRRKLMMYKVGITECDDELRRRIMLEEPTIKIIDLDVYDSSIATRCILEGAILLCYSMYARNLNNLVSIPVDWNIPIKIGLGYHKNCRPIVKAFIDVAKKLYYLNK